MGEINNLIKCLKNKYNKYLAYDKIYLSKFISMNNK